MIWNSLENTSKRWLLRRFLHQIWLVATPSLIVAVNGLEATCQFINFFMSIYWEDKSVRHEQKYNKYTHCYKNSNRQLDEYADIFINEGLVHTGKSISFIYQQVTLTFNWEIQSKVDNKSNGTLTILIHYLTSIWQLTHCIYFFIFCTSLLGFYRFFQLKLPIIQIFKMSFLHCNSSYRFYYLNTDLFIFEEKGVYVFVKCMMFTHRYFNIKFILSIPLELIFFFNTRKIIQVCRQAVQPSGEACS